MIVCLGWGSLIWNPGTLDSDGEWRPDGPELPIEFVRQSQDGRITLVIEPSSAPVQVLWVKMASNTVADAQESLRVREGNTSSRFIGTWHASEESSEDPLRSQIANWGRSIGASGIVWTALPARFNGKNDVVPSVQKVVDYLESLRGDTRARAEEYIKRAPDQVATPYRQAIERHLGWK
jgi:hypothetical protein